MAIVPPLDPPGPSSYLIFIPLPHSSLLSPPPTPQHTRMDGVLAVSHASRLSYTN